MQINISQPQLSDYPALIDLWESSVRATHHFLREEDIDFYRPMVTAALPLLDVYYAESDSIIQGFIGLGDEMIQALFIHPQARGKGIGKQLMLFAINQKGMKRVDVNEQNTQALGFYERLGFEVTGRTELDGVGKPYPLLLMALPKPAPAEGDSPLNV
ncbi:GNAT family N-acetyltransferase [Mucilaginibacter litoreus]|uniref:GNAT family N-acetyltransferase n=1 Tax=Mucilaginibacter litoreus TaxID=1048221 RepID=A0ABW3AV57_9SPHI